MKKLLALVAAGLVVVACGGAKESSSGSGSAASSSDTADASGASNVLASACVYPPAASTFDDASSVGCRPEPAGSVCQVSNGATVLADGGVTGGTESCSSLCLPGQYELVCDSGGVRHPSSPIPDPDSSLGCTGIPIPTPSDVLFYCCPCGS